MICQMRPYPQAFALAVCSTWRKVPSLLAWSVFLSPMSAVLYARPSIYIVNVHLFGCLWSIFPLWNIGFTKIGSLSTCVDIGQNRHPLNVCWLNEKARAVGHCALLSCFLQQISRHQEQFIQMLNEPPGELADISDVEGEVGAIGEEAPQMNYIQVTPQEKEAIERVRGLAEGQPNCWGAEGGLSHPAYTCPSSHSWRPWASQRVWWFRPTSPVKKTRTWLPTFSWVRTLMTSNAGRPGCLPPYSYPKLQKSFIKEKIYIYIHVYLRSGKKSKTLKKKKNKQNLHFHPP